MPRRLSRLPKPSRVRGTRARQGGLLQQTPVTGDVTSTATVVVDELTRALSVTVNGDGLNSINGVLISGSGTPVLTVTGTAAVSGTNTGDQTTITGNAATATQLATARAIYGNNFDGTAALNQIIVSTYGGTGNGFAKLSGPAASEKTFTLPNASCAILTDNAAVTAAQGGTGQSTYTLGDTIYCSAANTLAKLAGNTTTTKKVLTQTGTGSVSAAPAWGTLVQADISGLTTADSPQFTSVSCVSNVAGVSNLFTLQNTSANSGAYTQFRFGNDVGASRTAFLQNSSTNTTYAGADGFTIISSGNFGVHVGGAMRILTTVSYGVQITTDSWIRLDQRTATPTTPGSSAEGQIYIKGSKLIIQFNDGGTVRYKYLDLTGTGVTWVHTTAAP